MLLRGARDSVARLGEHFFPELSAAIPSECPRERYESISFVVNGVRKSLTWPQPASRPASQPASRSPRIPIGFANHEETGPTTCMVFEQTSPLQCLKEVVCEVISLLFILVWPGMHRILSYGI